jgi:hypothetical protein
LPDVDNVPKLRFDERLGMLVERLLDSFRPKAKKMAQLGMFFMYLVSRPAYTLFDVAPASLRNPFHPVFVCSVCFLARHFVLW